MAKNREPEKAVESQSESGEEEEDDEGSSEDIESESEPELTEASKKASFSTPVAQKKAQSESAAKTQQLASSSDEDESGSEFESDSEGPDTQLGPRKPRSKPNAAPEPVTPAKSTATKRPVDNKEGEEVKDAKTAKKKVETSEKKSTDDSKKLLFQRLWSEDDEIAILQGMIEYASKKKSDPVADLNAFHDFIRKNLHVDVTRTQLQDKIRRLKKKYKNNESKEKEGKDRTFAKPHEQKAYELSKSIWGNEAGKENGSEKLLASPKASSRIAVRKAAKKRPANDDNEEDKGSKSVAVVSGADNEDGKGSKSVVVEGEKMSVGKRVSYGGLSVEEMIMAAGLELFEAGKVLEGEREWKKLRVEEMEVYLRQLEVKTAQTRLVLDVLKSAEQ